MKVLHINTLDVGGAANACLRIHQSLLDKGIDSKVLLLRKTKDIPYTYRFDYWEHDKGLFYGIYKSLKMKLYKRKIDRLDAFRKEHPAEIFSLPNTVYDITEHPLYKEADIIQLNWTSYFLDEPSFFKKNKKPVIWRMADLYICGSGNHYDKGFPFKSYDKLFKKNYKIREKCLKDNEINVVAISTWTEQQAENSKLLKGQPITLIPNGIDTDVYKQYDKVSSREFLSLPQDEKIILFGSDDLSVLRKGTGLLYEAIDSLKNTDYYFCAFGKTPDAKHENIKYLGVVTDEEILARIYSAADIFVLPSIEETFGQVIIEAMACGTPVVSFPTGGALDAIQNGLNGFLTKEFSSKELASQIEYALNHKFDNTKIRQFIKDNFSCELQAERYIDLYNQILNK